MSAHIAIVGAGLAGLTCARRLADAGVEVTVFEKSRGPGGRCATRRSDFGPFHHGAPSFSARSPAFRAEVARWQAAGWVAACAQPGSWVGLPTMNTLPRRLAELFQRAPAAQPIDPAALADPARRRATVSSTC